MQPTWKNILLAFTFVLMEFISHAQNHVIDSLQNALKTEQNDTNKVNTLNTLSYKLWKIGKYGPSLIFANTARELAEKLDYKKGISGALHNCGLLYDEQGNYPQSFDSYFKSLAIDKQTGNKKGMAYNLLSIGIAYDEQGNYAEAMDYYSQSLSICQEIGDKNGICRISNNLGIIYKEQKNYSKAMEYFQKAIVLNREIGNKDGIAHNLGNIGSMCSDEGKESEALEYGLKALALYREIQNKRGIALNLGNIGDIYVKQKNTGLAKAYLDSALTLASEIREMETIRDVYQWVTILDSSTGNYQKAFEDHKKYIVYRDSLINRESVKKITQLEVRYEFEKKEEKQKETQEKKNIITYSILAILSLLIILAILFINRQQIKRKKDKLLFEKEKQHIEDELTSAKILLDEYLKSMMEKNDMLEKFRADIEHLTLLKAKEIDEKRVEDIENLNKITILTDDDWNKFKQLFERVHKGFFVRLKEKFPDLTQAEIRLICLSKLKTDTKKLAGILGVSTDAIKKARYRLRKKLGLSGDDNIDEIDISI